MIWCAALVAESRNRLSGKVWTEGLWTQAPSHGDMLKLLSHLSLQGCMQTLF